MKIAILDDYLDTLRGAAKSPLPNALASRAVGETAFVCKPNDDSISRYLRQE